MEYINFLKNNFVECIAVLILFSVSVNVFRNTFIIQNFNSEQIIVSGKIVRYKINPRYFLDEFREPVVEYSIGNSTKKAACPLGLSIIKYPKGKEYQWVHNPKYPHILLHLDEHGKDYKSSNIVICIEYISAIFIMALGLYFLAKIRF